MAKDRYKGKGGKGFGKRPPDSCSSRGKGKGKRRLVPVDADPVPETLLESAVVPPAEAATSSKAVAVVAETSASDDADPSAAAVAIVASEDAVEADVAPASPPGEFAQSRCRVALRASKLEGCARDGGKCRRGKVPRWSTEKIKQHSSSQDSTEDNSQSLTSSPSPQHQPSSSSTSPPPAEVGAEATSDRDDKTVCRECGVPLDEEKEHLDGRHMCRVHVKYRCLHCGKRWSSMRGRYDVKHNCVYKQYCAGKQCQGRDSEVEEWTPLRHSKIMLRGRLADVLEHGSPSNVQRHAMHTPRPQSLPAKPRGGGMREARSSSHKRLPNTLKEKASSSDEQIIITTLVRTLSKLPNGTMTVRDIIDLLPSTLRDAASDSTLIDIWLRWMEQYSHIIQVSGEPGAETLTLLKSQAVQLLLPLVPDPGDQSSPKPSPRVVESLEKLDPVVEAEVLLEIGGNWNDECGPVAIFNSGNLNLLPDGGTLPFTLHAASEPASYRCFISFHFCGEQWRGTLHSSRDTKSRIQWITEDSSEWHQTAKAPKAPSQEKDSSECQQTAQAP